LKCMFFKEWVILHCKRLLFGKRFFHMVTEWSQGNNALEPPAASLDICFQDREGIFHTFQMVSFAHSLYASHFKTLRGTQYTFQKLTQLQQWNKVLDPSYL
jgi:hypothetical protein